MACFHRGGGLVEFMVTNALSRCFVEVVVQVIYDRGHSVRWFVASWFR